MRVSIVTPSLNQGAFIAETLASVRQAVLRAEGVDVEHWVMDGGSSDETLDILTAQSEARWISAPDTGQSDAINKGLARCTGDILTYLCADDLVEPEALKLVATAFRENPNVDVVYGDFFFLEGNSGWRRPRVAGPYTPERLQNHNFLCQPATFWRRSVYERHGGFDAYLKYCMDHEYWLRIHKNCRWLYMPLPLATARLHVDAKTSSKITEAWVETARMADRYGLGARFRRRALWMRLCGGKFYRFRRYFYQKLGYWKAAQ